MTIDPFARLRAACEILCGSAPEEGESLAPALLDSSIDLHPHQIEAAVFALTRRFGRGAILADEVGLGKTVEAGLVIAERRARGVGPILVLTPASLRLQWCGELQRFFGIQARLLDARSVRRARTMAMRGRVWIASLDYFAGDSLPAFVREADWDLVVIDEAHRLRNVWRPGARRARRIRERLRGRRKLLLSATPFQNSLLELYGLVSFVDERLLGSEASFRARFLRDDRGLEAREPEELRHRLETVLFRTLRRQVSDSIRFTERKSLLYDFEPSAAERELYARVSEWLMGSRVIGLAFGNRALLVLAYRKILASSTFAVAATLRRLVETLALRLDGLEARSELPEDLDGFEEESEALAGPGEGGGARAPSREEIQDELSRLKAFLELAQAIPTNAKGERLLAALKEVFLRARARGQPEKAVVFTESRRTQDYLFDLLSREGFAGRVTRFHGGLGDAAERDREVEEFRTRTQIFLSTEAGAEGLNLQFCNIVVNYDLPWNPQRIEQRIGRCHRYGQANDVLVVNFLNTSNEADRRLYELLSSKLTLFDGVFGCSDEVLGALESGVDFERRVLDIYQSCRTPAEIDRAFRALGAELEGLHSERLAVVRARIVEHFDADVQAVLARRRSRTDADLASVERSARMLVLGAASKAVPDTGGETWRIELGAVPGVEVPERVRFTPGRPGSVLGPRHPLVRTLAERTLREEGVPRVHELTVEASGALAALRGRRGYWFLEQVTLAGAERRSALLEMAILEGGEAPLGPAEMEALRRARPVHRGYSALDPPPSIQAAAEQALAAAARLRLDTASGAMESALEEERVRIERHAAEARAEAAERLQRAAATVERARARVRELQEQGAEAGALREARSIAELLEGSLTHERGLAGDDEVRLRRENELGLAELRERLVTRIERLRCALARFWLV